MARKLLVAESHGRCPGLCVATVHLESLGNAPTRRDQLEWISSLLSEQTHCVLCGDFNFDSSQNYGEWFPNNRAAPLENDVLAELLPDFVDAWPAIHAIHGDNEGFTFDGVLNSHCVPDMQERMRYDRI